MMLKVTKAVFPVAGLGTRFLPATKASPKEMLPIVDKPLIQYAVEEAIEAGITELIFVTGRSKRAIEDHFDTSYEIEAELEARGKIKLLDLVRNIKPSDVGCFYVRQPAARGLGHAVMCAEKLIANDPFAVILADDLLYGERPVMKQMIDVFNHYHSSIVGVEAIAREDSRSYGVVEGREWEEDIFKLSGIVEKPAPEAYYGTRFDCGSKLGYLKATVEFALRHPEIGAAFDTYLREYVSQMTV
jgi:UTP--glucose-1-phosphate uridylyltransferase